MVHRVQGSESEGTWWWEQRPERWAGIDCWMREEWNIELGLGLGFGTPLWRRESPFSGCSEPRWSPGSVEPRISQAFGQERGGQLAKEGRRLLVPETSSLGAVGHKIQNSVLTLRSWVTWPAMFLCLIHSHRPTPTFCDLGKHRGCTVAT